MVNGHFFIAGRCLLSDTMSPRLAAHLLALPRGPRMAEARAREADAAEIRAKRSLKRLRIESVIDRIVPWARAERGKSM